MWTPVFVYDVEIVRTLPQGGALHVRTVHSLWVHLCPDTSAVCRPDHLVCLGN